jgi:hypothetical protein
MPSRRPDRGHDYVEFLDRLDAGPRNHSAQLLAQSRYKVGLHQWFGPVRWFEKGAPGFAIERGKFGRAANSKALMPEDAKEAIGHGVRGKRSKSGAVSFDVLASPAAATEVAHAPVQ